MRQKARERDHVDPETESILRASLEAAAEYDPLVRGALQALAGNELKPGRPFALGVVRQRNIALAVAYRSAITGSKRGDLAKAIRQVAKESGKEELSVKKWHHTHREFADLWAARVVARVSADREFACKVRAIAARQRLLDSLDGYYEPATMAQYRRHAPLARQLDSARILRDGSPSAVRDEEERILEFVRAIKSTER